jgi:hypothetical protein
MPAKEIGRFAQEARERHRRNVMEMVDRAIRVPNQRFWKYERWLNRRRRIEHEVDIGIIAEASILLDSVDLHRWPQVKDAIKVARAATADAARLTMTDQWRRSESESE